MFKPGTLLKLAAGYEKYLGWISGQDEYPDFWFEQSHSGLMLGYDYDNKHVRILVGDQIIVINPKALRKI